MYAFEKRRDIKEEEEKKKGGGEKDRGEVTKLVTEWCIMFHPQPQLLMSEAIPMKLAVPVLYFGAEYKIGSQNAMNNQNK